jgi:reverse transcriptase-like protein
MTPVEAATGEVPDISAMVPFWSIGVYHKTEEERRGPWDVKAVRVRMIGYSEEAKNSYYVYEIGSAKTIKVRHDCVWDETQLFGEIGNDNLEGEPAIDDLELIEEELRNNGELDESEAVTADEEELSEEDRYWLELGGQPYWAQLSEIEEWIDDAMALSARVLPALEGKTPFEPLVQPKSLKEAFEGPEKEFWLEALRVEVGNFDLREVFVEAPQTGHAMKTKLILKKVRKPDGSIKYKVRLVAKGFTQIKGVNYNETYAPTTSTSVVLVLFQLAVINKMDLSSFDVTAAFLEGKNDYPNFAWLPEGFGQFGGMRVEVVGNFYGEKQGPKIWNDKLNEIMIAANFERCPAQPCLYRKLINDEVKQVTCVHVDDGLMGTSPPATTKEFEKHLKSQVHNATFENFVKKYIGIDVSVYSDGRGRRVRLTHEQYINDNWSEFATETEVDSPMSSSHNLRKAVPVVSDKTMLHDTGKFRFACDRGRPDILVATGELATGGDKNPSHEHELVARRTKQYLYYTRTLGIELGEGELEIFGYSDAAYITEGNCKSRLGGCIFLNRFSGAVRSFSKTDTQPSSVSHSSTEAEIKAMDEWAREVMHIVDIVSFLIGRRYDKPIKLFVDNQSAILLCTTLKQSHKVKHINVRITFLRELVDAKFLSIHFVGTEDNTSDVLTKPLGKDPYVKHRKTLMVGHGGKLPPYKTLI